MISVSDVTNSAVVRKTEKTLQSIPAPLGYAGKLKDYFFGAKKKKAQRMPASLFYRKDENMGIEGFPFDLFISEKHKLSFKVGDHPLQEGSTLSDHIHQELQEVTIEGMFSNYHIRKFMDVEGEKFKDDFAVGEVDTTVSNTALDRFEDIKKLAKSKKPVRLVCSLEVYPQMLITDISYERDEKSGSSIRFTMTLREFKTASITSITNGPIYVPDSMKTDKDRVLSTVKKKGKTSAEQMSAEEMKKTLDVETITVSP